MSEDSTNGRKRCRRPRGEGDTIFVPGIGGISHSPRELTRWDHCAHGADVLLGTVLDMDRA
jgi:hypothetical protein